MKATHPRTNAGPQRGHGRLVADERGAATIEYVIIAGLIAIACIIGFRNFGQAVYDKVTGQTTTLNTTVTTTPLGGTP